MKKPLFSLFVILLLLVGCMNPGNLASGKASLCVLPQIHEGLNTQAVVSVYSKTTINHLLLKLFTLSGQTETPVLDAGGPVVRDLLNSDLDYRVTFSNLKTNTTYRVRAYAYKAAGTNGADLISSTASYVDVTMGTDDRPTLGNIPVLLTNVDFNGQGSASLAVTPGGFNTPDSEFLNVVYRISSAAGIYDYGENVQATNASLLYPSDVATDSAGNLYIADKNNNRVRKVDASNGIITTFAGNGFDGFSGDGGQATSAALSQPQNLAFAGGALYVVDKGNYRIRKVDLSTGVITTIAGSGQTTYSGDGGQATAVGLGNAYAISIADNKMYIAIPDLNRVRKLDLSTGIISKYAGGTTGFSGDGGLSTSATMRSPNGVAATSGTLYIADSQNNRIRKVDIGTGVISTIAGNGTAAYTGDGGQATSASMNNPQGVMVVDGCLYITDTGNHCIRKMDLSTGVITTVAGNGAANFTGDGGQATIGTFNTPNATSIANGKLYVVDQNNHRIRQVDLGTGIMGTFAGNGGCGYNAAQDGGPATSASMYNPTGVAVVDGKLYVADSLNQRIRMIDLSSGLISTVAGNGTAGYAGDAGQATSAKLNNPFGIAAVSGSLYIAEPQNQRVRMVNTSTGIITTVAGNGTASFTGDSGQATAARLNSPQAVAVADNKLYIADRSNNRIRRVDMSTGVITTVVGSGGASYSGDAGQATSATINSPYGIAAADGKLYIADSGNHRVRKVDLTTGLISTVAGNGTSGYAGDEGLATSASLSNPQGVMVKDGILFIADYGNHRIRMVDLSSGIIKLFAGSGTAGYVGDGGLAASGRLFYPTAIAADTNGNYYVADQNNHRIRRLD